MAMEVGGFRVKLDLSYFLNDFKKFSCIYVDLSRERQIVDVTDRISALFGIDGPICLLDENFYLPESENVNILRESTVIKVSRALHLQDRNSCSKTGLTTSDGKVAEFLGNSFSFKHKHSRNNNHTETSGNLGHSNIQNDQEVAHVYVEDNCYENRKKRKEPECDSIGSDDARSELLQENLKSEMLCQKKCKRKKEKRRKEDINYSPSKQNDDGLERTDTNNTNLERKRKRKKDQNKIKAVEIDDGEDRIASITRKNCSSLNESEQIEIVADSMKIIQEDKEKNSVLESLDVPKQDSTLLITKNTVECNLMVTASKAYKKLKKQLVQNKLTTEMLQEQSFHLSSEKYDTSFSPSYSKTFQKHEKEAKVDNQKFENNNNFPVKKDSAECFQYDFVDNLASSTPKETTEPKITETQLEQGNSESLMFPSNDSCIKINMSMKPRRKRTRTRKRKGKCGENDTTSLMNSTNTKTQIISWNTTTPKYSPSAKRKHIRFHEEEELETKDSSQQYTPLNNSVCSKKNVCEFISSTDKVSHTLETESANVSADQDEVGDCAEKLNSETDPNSVLNHSETKISQASLSTVPVPPSLWASSCSDLNSNSQEALQKLLALGKQNSSPVIFQRKRQNNSSSHELESLTTDAKENNKPDVGPVNLLNGIAEKDPSAVKYLETNPANINPLNYPLLEGKPKENDIIAFKVLKMTNSYTPEVSDFIIAKVLRICEITSEMVLQVEVGTDNFEAPKGRFYLSNDDSGKTEGNQNIVEKNWNELMEVRILFP